MYDVMESSFSKNPQSMGPTRCIPQSSAGSPVNLEVEDVANGRVVWKPRSPK